MMNFKKNLLSVAALFAMGCMGGAAEPAKPATPVVLAPDAAWCWFGNPKAIFKDGVLYYSYVRHAGEGRAAMSAYDPKNGAPSLLWTSSFRGCDDHNNAGILPLSDGRMLAIYAQHHGEKQFYFRHSLTAKPVTAADWGPEQRYTNVAENVTYSNPYQLKAESGRVYNFFRCLNFNPTFVTSENSGEQWSAPRIFIKVGVGTRPYVQYCSDYDKRVDFLYTDGHPDAVKTSLFHGYYENGGYYRTDGTFLRKLEDAPLLHDAKQPERGTVVYQYSEEPTTDYHDHIPFGRAWSWDIACDSTKAPVTVFSVNRFKPDPKANWDERRLQYYYARWNGKGWTRRLIGQAGAPLYNAAFDYAAGITLDPANPNVVYLSSNAANPFDVKDIENVPLRANKRYEIYRGVTNDGGLTFQWQPLTMNSSIDNIRPYVPRGNSDACGLTWVAGTYRSYGDYDAALYGFFDAQPPSTPFATGRSLACVSFPRDPASIPPLLFAVADWQLEHNLKGRPLTDWIQGAGFTGFTPLMSWPGREAKKYEQAMAKIGETNQWKLGPQCRFHADDICVGQMYLELYKKQKKPEMIADVRQVMDEYAALTPETEKNLGGHTVHWTWCDALYMAPAVLAKLYAITGEMKYHDKLVQEFKRTTDFLFDKEENLFFRDSGYFTKREANGKKVFWGRGNGWVFGGLTNVLSSLPKDAPSRPYFEEIFKKLAGRIMETQQPDGLWRASLLDPESYPVKETSGSGFYCYGLAWGINNGLLDRATALPHVEKAWAALAACVTPEGKLTHVQPVGADPRGFKPDSTEAYGVGAFLLAGTEIYSLLQHSGR